MKTIILMLCNLLMITKASDSDDIIEEANPIRSAEKIDALSYKITINNVDKKKIIYDTRIIESINHYLDTSDIDKFTVNFNINNNDEDKYYLKKIVISNKYEIIKIYNYNKLIDNTKFSVKLNKEILDKVIKDSKVTGNIEIIIEK